MSKTIYKFFRTNEYFFDTIISNQLFFSSISQFNDPYDCHLTIGKEIPKEQFENYIKDTFKSEEHISKHLRAFRKDPERYSQRHLDGFIDFLNYYGICCFSKIKSEILLWSHYADSHRGVALGFDFEMMKNQYKQFDDVDYDDEPYIFKLDDIETSIAKTILRKSTNWKYEQEVRFLIERSRNVSFNMAALKEVNFGKKCPKRMQLSIHYLIDKLGYNNCSFFAADINKAEFDLTFNQIDFDELKKEVLDESREKRFSQALDFKDLLDN